MKYQILLLSVFLFQNVNSQEEDSSSVLKNWQFGSNFSVDYTYRHLNTDNSNLEWIIQDRNKWESPKFGFTTGLNALYFINSKWSLGFGIQYSTKGYKMELDDIYVIQDVDEAPVPADVKTWYRMDYIDLPICLSFYVGQKKVRFVGSAGVAANFFLNKRDRNVVTFDDGTQQIYVSQIMNENKTLVISPMISAGISYMMNEHTALRLEPTFRYGITRIEDAPITTTLFSTGVNLSYYFSF